MIEPYGTSRKAIESLLLALVPIGIACLPGMRFERLGSLGAILAVLSIIIGLLAFREVRRSGGALQGSFLAFFGILLSVGWLGVYLDAGNEVGARGAARRSQAMNNLKQIGLALHNYQEVNGRFPPAVVYSPRGTPLYSWRVLILPYMEQRALYDDFHLDEPWNSYHNRKLLDRRPPAYDPIRRDVSRTKTFAQVFNGSGTAFEGRDGVPLSDFPDGLSATIAVVEGAEPVEWTRPMDLPYSPTGVLMPFGRTYFREEAPSGTVALFADGATRFLKRTTTESILRGLITRNGGEPITADQY